MFSEDKRDVRQDDPENPFKDGVALWLDCASCGAPILVPSEAAPFCGGPDASRCADGPRHLN